MDKLGGVEENAAMEMVGLIAMWADVLREINLVLSDYPYCSVLEGARCN